MKRRAKTLAYAVRAAVEFMQDGKQNVRVELPSGETMDFDTLQAAIIKGDLKD